MPPSAKAGPYWTLNPGPVSKLIDTLSDGVAASSAAACANALGPRRRPAAAVADEVGRLARRWAREAEDIDPKAALAAHRASAKASSEAASRLARRMRRVSETRPRRRAPKPHA